MMKTIDKMTDQEIYNLTDEQVEKLIVTRCVEEGVRFIDEPPIMKTYDYKPISPSHFFYYLEGLSIAVLDQNDAIKIAKILSEFDLYRTSYDFVVSNEELCGKLDIINIKHIPMFDTKDKETYKSIKDKNGEIEKEYKDQVDKYTKLLDYNDDDVYSMINKKERGIYIYGRVSTSKQKKDLENQIELLKTYCFSKGYKISGVYKDIASGISLDNRKDMLSLIKEVINYRCEKVVITYKDRLSRIGFEMFKNLFGFFGCEIEIMSEVPDTKTDEKEIFEEIISILHCYSMKMYGKRKGNTLEVSDKK